MQRDFAQIVDKSLDYLKPRSNKNKFECKKCDCTEFYMSLNI